LISNLAIELPTASAYDVTNRFNSIWGMKIDGRELTTERQGASKGAQKFKKQQRKSMHDILIR
jgi:hypothetical protein